MIANHVHQALAQVKALRQNVIDNQRFRGWSGRARVSTGGVALLAAVVLASDRVPAAIPAHLIGWATVFAVAVAINAGSIAYWFLFDPQVSRQTAKLRPVLELLPSVAVGGVLTLVLWRCGQVDLLFGMWMMLFGLTNLAGRRILPRSLAWVGLFYLLAGTACVIWPGQGFLNPWPMGLVFAIGELAGGTILHLDKTRRLA